jgi:hypothetical protein
MGKLCNLCDQDLPLIRAHIIPEFLYTSIYNEKHSFIKVQEKDKNFFQSIHRKGLYDSNILCQDCDAYLGKLDDYASKVFNGHEGVEVKGFHDKDEPRIMWTEAIGADADKMKRFFISVLWRAHISELDFFSDVDLGRSHSDHFRNIILDPYSQFLNDYELILLHYSIADEDSKKFLTSIKRFRRDGYTLYAAMWCGIMVHWYFKPDNILRGVESFTLKKINGLKVLYSTKQGFDAIRYFLGEKALNANNFERNRKVKK